MGGNIVKRNLRRHLAEEDIPPTAITDYVTIEELSHEILEEARDEPVVELTGAFRQRLLEQVLNEAESGTHGERLETFATRIEWEDDETIEQLDGELSDYLRCTNSTANHDRLVELARTSENHFVREAMPERLETLRKLVECLEEVLADEGEEYVPTRSHAVSAAADVAAEEWSDTFGDRDWLAVATLNVVDNTTLQFLLAVGECPDGPDLHFFFGNGTYDRQIARLESMDQVTSVETPDADIEPSDHASGSAAETLLGSINGEDVTVPDSLNFVEAPERRREVEHVVRSIRQDLREGTDPDDILVVARDVGRYQSLVEDVFETNELPYHVQTPRPHAHLPAYRFFKSLLDLFERVAADQPLSYEHLTDPLRLGFSMPGTRSSIWPLDDRIFLYLEQRLHGYQERADAPSLQFEEWVDAVEDMGGWDLPWDLCKEYLEWIQRELEDPPQSGEELREFMRTLLRWYIYQRIPDQRGIPQGPGVDASRTNLGQIHPSSSGRQIYSQANAVGRHYDFVRSMLEEPASWEVVSRSVGEVLGGGRYGMPNNDGNAIEVVDAGNAYYHDANETYILGLAAGEFPMEVTPQPFIHQAFRNEVAKRAIEGEAPSLHFDSRSSQYEVEINLYEAALRASSGSITVLHRYKDEDRNQIEWSPFVDLLPTDEHGHRIRADQWLPQPEAGSEWENCARRISPKDRMRLLYHHSLRDHPSRRPSIEPGDVSDIATYADETEIEQAVMPRYDRYGRPPTTITVSADEPAFDDGLSLADAVGGPVRPQELDLLGQCELKYYFYQLLYNREGNDIERNEIPFYRSGQGHYRYGTLPQVIRHHYPEQTYVDRWKTIVDDLLPNRQADISAFGSLEELQRWFENHDEFSGWDEKVLLPTLEQEWRLVQAELEEGIERTWEWRESTEIQVDGGSSIRQPGHRRDRFPNDDGYALPVFPVRNTSYAEKASKQCWNYDGQDMNRRCHSICHTCGEYEDCDYSTKYVLDHRLHTVVAEGSDVVGVQFQERFDNPDRRGLLKGNHSEPWSRLTGTPEDDFSDDSFDVWLWHQHWVPELEEDIVSKVETLGVDDGEVTLEVNQEFVSEGGCDSCVYQDMCMVPHVHGGEQ